MDSDSANRHALERALEQQLGPEWLWVGAGRRLQGAGGKVQGAGRCGRASHAVAGM